MLAGVIATFNGVSSETKAASWADGTDNTLVARELTPFAVCKRVEALTLKNVLFDCNLSICLSANAHTSRDDAGARPLS